MIDNNKQPPQVFLRRPAVELKTALSRSRIYALMAIGEFPKPVYLGAMSVAWIDSEVDDWMAARITAREV